MSRRAAEHPRRGAASFRSIQQDPRTRLDEAKTHLVATHPRIVAKDIVGKRRQLAEELHPNEAAADHDDREAAATKLGSRLRPRARTAR